MRHRKTTYKKANASRGVRTKSEDFPLEATGKQPVGATSGEDTGCNSTTSGGSLSRARAVVGKNDGRIEEIFRP